MSNNNNEPTFDVEAELADMGQDGLLPYVFPFPFGTVDAGFWEFFANIQPVRALYPRRTPLTSSSAEYRLFTTFDNEPVATIRIRMVSDKATYLETTLDQRVKTSQEKPRNTVEGYVGIGLQMFEHWLWEDYKRVTVIAQAGTTPRSRLTPSGPSPSALKELEAKIKKQRGPGAAPDSDYERARREIAVGRPWEAVFHDYLLHQRVDQNDSRAVAKARDRFRKAMGYKKRRK